MGDWGDWGDRLTDLPLIKSPGMVRICLYAYEKLFVAIFQFDEYSHMKKKVPHSFNFKAVWIRVY